MDDRKCDEKPRGARHGVVRDRDVISHRPLSSDGPQEEPGNLM
jgi:hypothetical protein